MKKYFALLMVLIYTATLCSAILEVSKDGTKPFTSIQSAINVANNNDIIRVHPGEYIEELTITMKSITLESLYATIGDTLYIHNTKLLFTYPGTVININNDGYTNNTVTIDGFTINNNINNFFPTDMSPEFEGFAIFVRYSNVNLKNNIVTESISRNAVISLSAFITDQRNAYFENNKIFNNRSYWSGGGGLYIGSGVNFIFSQDNRNSIYNNIGTYGKDIGIFQTNSVVEIYLDKGSRIASEVDNHYIAITFSQLGHIHPDDVVIDILQETLPPLVNHDLFVAPWGDDSNSGLSPSDPLKTIYYATTIITSDPINPKTIHLAPGIYKAGDGQILPFFVPAWTNLQGAGIDETIFEDAIGGILYYWTYTGEVNIDGFTIRNSGFPTYVYGINGQAKKHIVSNIKLENNQYHTALVFSYTPWGIDWDNDDSLYLKNIININSQNQTMNIGSLMNVNIENFIVDNTTTYNRMLLGVMIDFVPNLIINNMSMTNVKNNRHSVVFGWANSHFAIHQHGNAVLNNVLIANNESFDIGNTAPSNFGTAYLTTRFIDTTLNNWTIANNKLDFRPLQVSGDNITMNNMILHNPEMQHELLIVPITIQGGGDLGSNVTINNSLVFNNKINVIWGSEQPTLNNVIFVEPEFAGHFNNILTPDKWEYYFLNPGSPAIDFGIDVSDMMPLDADLAGNPRVYGESIDLGVFEFQGLTANFTATPRAGMAPLEVQFTDLSYGGSVYAWEWDFGVISNAFDRNKSVMLASSTEQNPIFIYENDGEYTVTLTINNGERSITKESFIVIGQSVYADFIAEPVSGQIPLGVQFMCQSIGAVSWEWDFTNDGKIDSTEKNPHFIYTESGVYTVTLSINNGESSITKPNFIDTTVDEIDETIPPFLGVNLQSYPNPINISRNSNTLISFDTKEKAINDPYIEIYNVRGQKIRTLSTGISFFDLAIKAGLAQENLDMIQTRNYSVIWDMRDENNRAVSSGVYFYRAIVDGEVIGTNRMVLIK
ncbi:MAG: PKD domain-containing protein [Candidatus Cloacimonetes bacterium]|nr:PKD domain-containing protein [Candidatus Cloacimonadota bacterium]